MLTLPNLERLKVFHAVYTRQSIQDASVDLNVTRSAVSQSLKALELEGGVQLFLRNSKNFRATSAAEELFRVVDPFLHRLSQSLASIHENATLATGLLRIGAPMDFGSTQLTQIIGLFHKRYPQIAFELTLATPLKQLDLLCAGHLDLAFIDNGDVHARGYPVTIQRARTEEFVLVAAPTVFKKLELSQPTSAKIAASPIVDYLPHAPVLRLWFKHHFQRALPNLNIIYSAESVHAVLTAIDGELGLGVVPDRLLTGEFAHLRKIETPRGRWINHILIARRQGLPPSAREKIFLEFCKAKLVKNL